MPKPGARVIAIEDISEFSFETEGVAYFHALAGEFGTVQGGYREAGWVMVRWDRTDTACDTHPDEIAFEGPALTATTR